MFKLVELSKLVCNEVDFNLFLKLSGDILRLGGVRKAIVIDGSNRVARDDGLCDVLKRLGCVYAPVTVEGDSETLAELIKLEELGFYEDINPEPVRVFTDTLELLYRNWPTPLVKLKSLSDKDVNVWCKLEWYNPYSCSIKDRTAWYMFKKALEKLGRINALYEATSTNTGLALAALANIHGVKSRFYLPSTTQRCVDYIFRLMGADVSRGKPTIITTEMIEDVKRDALRDGALNLNQFENDYNFEAHLRYTAKEIDLQVRSSGLRLAAVISGLGTSGHLSAISHYMKNRYGDHVRVIGVVPAENNIIPGIKRIESGMKWVHLVKIDKIYEVTLEEALERLIDVARKDGILVGLSGGAVLQATRKAINEGLISKGDIIAIVPDHGLKYIEIIERCIEVQSL